MAKVGRPTSWPEPKTPLSFRLQQFLPEIGLAKLSQKYFGGIAKETVGKYLSGDSEPPVSTILQLCEIGEINPLYVIFGVGHEYSSVKGLNNEFLEEGPGTIYLSESPSSAIQQVPPMELPVIGMAAADNDDCSRAEIYADEHNIETIQAIKEHYKVIQITGNSMEPVVLDGQYVIIGSELRPNAKLYKQGWIGVVQIDCDNAELPEDISCEGVCTFCKRIYSAGPDMLLLTSINSAECTPFTVMRANIMHLWPVHGVLFAGHGSAPED